MPWSWSAPRRALLCWLLLWLLPLAPALAAVQVEVVGPGGRATQTLPDAGGGFDLNLPLTRNAVNNVRVSAVDANGNRAEQSVVITQVSLDSVVVSRVTSERLAPQQIEALVADGVIALDNPANYNVSVFNIVLTIGNRPVPVSVPIASPIVAPEETGYETYAIPAGRGDGGSSPKVQDTQIIVFEQAIAVPGQPAISLPGVIVIEGRIKSLKEFFSVRLLLMNTSGIFTLSDVNASILFPTGGLTSMLPVDGVAAFGAIAPGNAEEPGQAEREFVVRGDEIGERPVSVEFGGFLTGPGIPIEEPIPFSGRAGTTVDVRGPPTFDVQVVHPDAVVAGVPYALEVQITNTDSIPALYATLDLAVGFDSQLLRCAINPVGEPVCTEITGADLRNLGHLLPGESTTQVFTVRPLRSGTITTCMAAADQNLSLRVVVGTIGCLVGELPPVRSNSDGTPAVSVLPSANMTGVGGESPVVAFFSQMMRTASITTGPAGAFNVYTSGGDLIPGTLRFDTLNERTVVVWQPIIGALAGNTEYTVVITTDVVDADGLAMTNPWSSNFTTTGTGDGDVTPPELTLSVAPPADPSHVIPGQVVRINAYAADQGSGIVRVEARIKDLGVPGALYQLMDQRSVFAGDLPPFIFAIDSTNLIPGHDYQLLVTAYDGAGNARDATLALLLAANAAPPTVTLPTPPTQPVPQGISIDLTPTAVSAGVREVAFFLDGAPAPWRTVTTAPFQATLGTLSLPAGPHSVRAVATDGLDQTGEAAFAFAVGTNDTPPTIRFPGAGNGQQIVAGESLTVGIAVEDGTGITATQVYLDDPALPQPLAIAGTGVRIDTSGLAPGNHRLVVLATNGVGVRNDPAAPGSYLEFVIVTPPTGAPPPTPVLSALEPLASGQVRVSGQSVAGARVTITNQTTAFATQVNADAGGLFSALIDAAPGDRLTAVAFNLASSPNPSDATQATVPTPPQLVSISATPASLAFTSAGALGEVTVRGQYDNGSSADLTTGAAFRSTATSVATVTAAGRVAAVGNGSAEVVVTVGGREARVPVTVNIVTLQSIAVTPAAVGFSFIGATAQLAVTGQYSNGSTQNLTGQASFSSADAALATVTSTGLVRAVNNGATLMYVAAGGLPPVAVPVTINSAADTPPTVAILTPATGGQVEPGAVIGVTVRAQDAVGGVTGITITASGAVSDSRQVAVSPAANDAVRSVSFTVPGTAAIGSTLRLEAAATDTAGHSAPVAVVTLTVVDQTAPTVSITAPAPQTPYNFGDHILVQVTAADAVGVASLRVATTGALTLADQSQVQPAATPASATFTLTVPPGTPGTELRLLAFARDAAGNEGAAIPVDVILTGADITPPATVATAASAPGTSTQVSYTITEGLTDLAHVELWFRRNGLGTFNRYTGADGTGNGEFPSPGGATGSIAFDATRMGGDGNYEFATVGVDLAGNREALPTDGQGAPAGDAGVTATFATGASVLLITSNTEIADAAFDGRNVRVQGATLTLVGDRTFHNVELLNGAVLTHRETTQTEAFGLHVQVWTLSVDTTSRIDAVGRGYLGGNRAGLGETAHTVGFTAGAQRGNGGSYGGLGGHSSSSGSAVPNPVNGNLVNPVDLGSGGGAWGGAGGDGGGRVLLSAINLAVDGTVRADGGLSSGSASGEGSGGSINLAARTLSGKGTITANGGGTGGANHTGGGGGRVAIRSLDISTLNLAGITAKGGDGYYGDGADGTVYLLAEGQAGGELVLNGQGANSPFTDLIMPPGQTLDAITLQNGARVIVQEPIRIAETLRLRDNSLLTSPTANEAGLQIEARRVIVESGSAIDVTGRGYLGGDKAGLGQTAHTLGFTSGAQVGNGGSHGGLGAHYSGGTLTNPVYGDPRRPDRLGSGGAAWGGAGGDGGGYLRIIASEAVIVEGAIRADGGLSGGSASGEGAGGSVWITTSRLAGAGSISANGGGTGGYNHTGGGGGRVAVYADYVDGSDAFGGLRSISAWRGRGYYDNTRGSAGTVYLKIGGVEDLIIDDNESTATAATGTPLPLMGPGLTKAATADTLITDGILPLLPNALAGLRLNPDLDQGESFAILANGTDSIRVATPNEHGVRFADVAGVGKGYAGDYRYTNLRLRRGGHLEMGDRLTVSDTLRIAEFGLLTHPQTTVSYEALLDLGVGTLEIDPTGRIDATGRGYLGGDRAGLGQTAHTLGLTAGAQSGNGGSYGGLGGHYSGSVASNPIYGSLTDPQDLGSGGGAWGGAGGDGGGRVFITAAAIHNAGAIHADGGLSSGSVSGEGSGGTVNIRAGNLTGNGLITANGGTTGGGNHIGGGGGRIAIRYSGTLSLPQSSIQSRGGDGYYGDGGHGTIYLQRAGQTYGDLTIDGSGFTQPADTVTIPGGLTFDNILLRNGARVVADAGLHVLGTLSIGANSTLTHSGGLEAGLQIEAARVVVESGGAIDVTGRGYLGGNKSGLGETAHTLGFAAGAQHGHGGSHGGLGASYSGASGDASPVYGDPARPNRLGSGGGAWSGAGGDGGGYVRIQASESVVVEGAIRADGSLSSGSISGEGAGGSVWITTAHLAGAGSISANGGTTNGGNHTGGGGGRVAIDADAVDGTDAFAGLRAISAWRGRGYYDNTRGGAGTVYLKIGGVEELIIDDNDTSVSSPTGTPFSLMGPGVTAAVTADSLTTDGEIPLLTNALVGLRVNPDLEQAESFTILSNSETEIVVETPNENGVDFMDVAAVGKGYIGDYRYSNLTLRGAGHLDLGDRLTITDTLRITEHGLMTHPETTTTYAPMLDIEAGRLEIDTTGRIDVTGRGYLGGNKGGLGETAYTLDFASGAQRGNGGSYGGIGGHYSGAGGATNLVYGSPTDPADLGSGGGAWGGTGGDGGGRVFITAGVMENDGAIRADGSLSTGSVSGEGSGGTVNIRTGDLTGSGLITASGGTTGGGNHVGGGGGRIGIRYSGILSLPGGNIQTHGGDGYYGDGTVGTIHLEAVAP